MQEFMILPTGAANFTEAMRIGAEVYHNLKSVIKKKYGQDGKKLRRPFWQGKIFPDFFRRMLLLRLLLNKK